MLDSLQGAFEKFENERYEGFENIEPKYSEREDVHAFILLDKLVPHSRLARIINAAEHDQIWLNVDLDTLASVATEEHIRQLCICGVFYDTEADSLSMFR